MKNMFESYKKYEKEINKKRYEITVYPIYILE